MRTHMSSPRYQYSYWAERILACKRPMPARTFVPFDKRSLINFHPLWLCQALQQPLFCSCIPGTVQAHGVQVEPLLDVADHRRQVFAEEWEPGWVYRHLLSQSSVQQRFQVGPWPLLRLVVVGGDIQHYQCLVVLQGDTALHWDRHLVLYVDWRQSGNASGRELQTVE